MVSLSLEYLYLIMQNQKVNITKPEIEKKNNLISNIFGSGHSIDIKSNENKSTVV